jgi:hypothetical protein
VIQNGYGVTHPLHVAQDVRAVEDGRVLAQAVP